MPHKNNTSLVAVQPVTICDLDQKQIESRIFTFRGVQVMLDRDLAFFFGVETKALNQAVKRNAIRFPEDFMFQLTKEEAESVLLEKSQSDSWSQNVTLKRGHNIKYLPYAFTEEGVSQLSSILKSPIAAEMSVHIVRAFVAMRRYIATHAALFQRIESLEEFRVETRRSLQEVNERFDNLLSKMDDDLYHFGASFNELGKRLFAFDKMGLDKNLILSQLLKQSGSNNPCRRWLWSACGRLQGAAFGGIHSRL